MKNEQLNKIKNQNFHCKASFLKFPNKILHFPKNDDPKRLIKNVKIYKKVN